MMVHPFDLQQVKGSFLVLSSGALPERVRNGVASVEAVDPVERDAGKPKHSVLMYSLNSASKLSI